MVYALGYASNSWDEFKKNAPNVVSIWGSFVTEVWKSNLCPWLKVDMLDPRPVPRRDGVTVNCHMASIHDLGVS